MHDLGPYDADYAIGLIALGKLACMQDVARFTCTILNPSVPIFIVIEVGHFNSTFGSEDLGAARRDPHNANAVFRSCFGCLYQDGLQQFGEQKGGHIVCAQLLLVTLLGLAALGWNHDAGVVPEDVQSVVFFEKGIRSCFDGCQVIQVKMKKDELSL